MEEKSQIPEDEKRRALQQVLESDTFARSEQLRHFLRYVGEMTLAGRGRDISEYSIATDALGRPPTFSPADDSSVRSRAYELRQKLQRYYLTEAGHASVRIDLPKGSYSLQFAPWHPGPDRNGSAGPRASATPDHRRRTWVAATVCVALIAVALALVAPARREVDRVDSIIREAWGPLADPRSDLVICVGTSLHMIVRPYMSVVAEGLPKYPAQPELYPLFRQHRPLPPGADLWMHPVDNSVQMGHLSAVVALSGVLQRLGAGFQILPERTSRVPALRSRSVLLIGDPQNSEAAAEFLAKTPLTIDYDPGVDDLVVRDRRKPPGARSIAYVPRRGQDKRYSEVYGLVTVMPAPGAPDRRRVLILSGITSVGTHGAAEFFVSPGSLADLRTRFQSQGVPGFPNAYQVVVRCKSNDTLLLSAEYQAHAVMDRFGRGPASGLDGR
jgi:hypothetical protein